jgi:hypothetical protein
VGREVGRLNETDFKTRRNLWRGSDVMKLDAKPVFDTMVFRVLSCDGRELLEQIELR